MEGEYDVLDRHYQYEVKLPWPEQLREGIWFSSAPQENIVRLKGMPQWYQRVDAFVENGALVILVYKKVGQLAGYPDGSKWFSEEFRQRIREKKDERDRR